MPFASPTYNCSPWTTSFIATSFALIRESYDQIADEYALRIYNELQHKPLDCVLLDDFYADVVPSSLTAPLHKFGGRLGLGRTSAC